MKLIKHPFVLTLLSALLLSISWPTYGFPFLLFGAFVPLLFLEKELRIHSKHPKKSLLIYSYLAFVIWNYTTIGWLQYADLFGMLFAVLINSLLMSLLMVTYHKVAKKTSQNISLIFFITLWISFEKMHLEWDFSWPWLNLGNAFSEYTQSIQWYEYTGTFGGSLWVLILNILLFKAIETYNQTKTISKLRLGFMAGLIGIPILFSVYLYHSYSLLTEKTKEVIVLQPNVDPYTEKYSQLNSTVVSELLQLTQTVITPQTDFVISPETVLAEQEQFKKFSYSTARIGINNYIKEHPNTSFLLGIDTHDVIRNQFQITPSSNQFRKDIWVNFYNAALYLDSRTPIQNHYKSKLVVGVENMPYKSILEPLLGGLMIDLGGTMSTKTTQNRPTVFKAIDSTQVAPVICYESVYGEYVTQYVQDGAEFLAIMTNDAWWNETQGHKQHLSLARLRAIETRRDIARSANTGISAFINQKGDITKKSKYNEKVALLSQVQLNNELTFYVKYGDFIARISFWIMITILLVSLTKRRHEV